MPNDLFGYTFKDVHGGIIVDKDGNTVCGIVGDTILMHKGDEVWNKFQRIAAQYVAQLIKGEK